MHLATSSLSTNSVWKWLNRAQNNKATWSHARVDSRLLMHVLHERPFKSRYKVTVKALDENEVVVGVGSKQGYFPEEN